MSCANSPAERRLLLYFETCAVDRGGLVESVRMNADDFALARTWNDGGFIKFGRIAFHDIKGDGLAQRDHWVELSVAAWQEVEFERKARCTRLMRDLTVQRLGWAKRDMPGSNCFAPIIFGAKA